MDERRTNSCVTETALRDKMESKADKNFEDDSNDIDMTLADTDSEPEIDEAKSTKPKLFRLSSRIASLKRRGIMFFIRLINSELFSSEHLFITYAKSSEKLNL